METKENKEYILQTCYHCGNKGLLKAVSKFVNRSYDYVDDTPTCWYDDYYYTLHCPVCHEVSILKRSTAAYLENPDGTFDFAEEDILYPNIKSTKLGVPKDIVSAFESAKKVEKIDSSICALSLRRVLELICIDKQALGDNLEKKIKDLVNKNILPSTFDEACKHIRIIGNEGAHENQISIPAREIKTLIEYMESIINYLYVLPEKIKRLTKIKTGNGQRQ